MVSYSWLFAFINKLRFRAESKRHFLRHLALSMWTKNSSNQQETRKEYLEKRAGNNAYWKKRALQHGHETVATATTDWVRRSTLGRLRTLVKSLDRVLEVGCGNASSLLSCLSLDCRAYGVDLTMEMLVLAKQRHTKIRGLFRSDACYLPFQDATFDVVYTSRCLINVLDAEMQRLAIRELLRVATPTGVVVLIENFEEPIARMNQAKERFHAGAPETDEHNLRLNLNTTIEYSRQLGWSPIRIRGNTLASFVHHVVAGRLTRHGGSGIAARLLYPVYIGLTWLEDCFGAGLPLFGKDTMVVLKREHPPMHVMNDCPH
jgi:SAM-dependent methyltransferase